MKFMKSGLLIASVFCIAGANATDSTRLQNKPEAVASSTNKAGGMTVNLQESIKAAAELTLDYFENNYGGTVKDSRMLIGYLPLVDWMYEDTKTNQTFLIGNPKLNEHLAIMALPKQVENWFLPLDAMAVKMTQGDATARDTLMLRLIALNVFLDAGTPENNWSNYQINDLAAAQMAHYSLVTLNLEFANLFSSEIAKRMHTSYVNKNELFADFVTALGKIPDARIYEMMKDSAKTAQNAAGNGFNISAVNATDQIWESGQYKYTSISMLSKYSRTKNGISIAKSGKQIYGSGYINGNLDVVVVSRIDDVPEIKNRSELAN